MNIKVNYNNYFKKKLKFFKDVLYNFFIMFVCVSFFSFLFLLTTDKIILHRNIIFSKD